MKRSTLIILAMITLVVMSSFIHISSHHGEESDQTQENLSAKENEKSEIIVQYNKLTNDSGEQARKNAIKEINVEQQDIQQSFEKLKSQGDILHAEENVPIKIHGVSNDAYSHYQWHLESIHAAETWESNNVTENNVTVAVIDSGVDPSHPDLEDRVIPGYNFLADNTDTMDENGHGTAISGVIAATYNNQVGITGVSGDAKVEILPLKVASSDGTGQISDMIHAVDYAVEHGADVINISMGASSYSSILQDAIHNAVNQDIVVIASAGNEGDSNYVYPASYKPVLSVGAVSNDHTRSTFSSYNDRVDVVAPGEEILTTGLDDSYKFYDGTSFSSAVLSGMAAYMKASNSSLSSNEVVSITKETARDLGTAGKDDQYGFGLVNLAEAVSVGQEKATPITDITFEEEELALTEGETTKLTPTITPEDASDYTLNWESANKNVASVNEDGKVTAIGPGDTMISVSTSDGNVNTTIPITVKKAESEFSIPEGYKELEKLKINGNDFYLQVKFSVAIDPDSVNQDTVYILDRNGEKLDVQYQFESDYEKLNVITPSNNYEIGKSYYLFVDREVTSKAGEPLSQPITTEFMWDEESGTLTIE